MSVRKLWIARLLFALAAAGLAAVVAVEHRQQASEDDAVQRMSAPASHQQALEAGGDAPIRRR
jgi:hypothetical protein